jgi:hypothetical protein
VSRIFKMSIGANLKLLKKIDEKLEKIMRYDNIERYKLAKELQENIEKWKSDIGYEEGVKEISKIN